MQTGALHWILEFPSMFATFLYCYPLEISTPKALEGGITGTDSKLSTRTWELGPKTDSALAPRAASRVSQVELEDLPTSSLFLESYHQNPHSSAVNELPIFSPTEVALQPRPIALDDGYQNLSSLGSDALPAEETLAGARKDAVPIASQPADADSKHGRLEAVGLKSPSLQPSEAINEPCPLQPDDMIQIAGQTVIHLESSPELPDYFCATPVSAANEDNNVLRVISRDRRNIVLDSVSPDVTPHIVITPPEDSWDDSFIQIQNAVGYQCPCCLVVPLQAHNLLTYMPITSPELTCESNSTSKPIDIEVDVPSRMTWSSRALFSHSAFTRSVQLASTERLIFCHVVSALQRHLCKATAFAASGVAPSFRQRYDCPDFVSSIEKPFRWIDPAEPLLAYSRHLRGTTIIDSISPFVVPHIIINEGPPQDLWIAWNNVASDVQDYRHLTVPPRSFTYNRSPDYDDDDDNNPLMDYYFPSDQEPEDQSRPDTPVPDTPQSVYCGDPNFLLDCSHCNVEDDEQSYFQLGQPMSECSDALPPSASCPRAFSAGFARLSCEVILETDEDEDSLPPFDDWYQNIAQRTWTDVS